MTKGSPEGQAYPGKWVGVLIAVGISLSSIALHAEECKSADMKAKPMTSVAAACKKGGVKEARKKMKELKELANTKLKAGEREYKCDKCHDTDNEDDEFKLRKDAREDFKKMLEVIDRK